jgi:hypothetical protein
MQVNCLIEYAAQAEWRLEGVKWHIAPLPVSPTCLTDFPIN